MPTQNIKFLLLAIIRLDNNWNQFKVFARRIENLNLPTLKSINSLEKETNSITTIMKIERNVTTNYNNSFFLFAWWMWNSLFCSILDKILINCFFNCYKVFIFIYHLPNTCKKKFGEVLRHSKRKKKKKEDTFTCVVFHFIR